MSIIIIGLSGGMHSIKFVVLHFRMYVTKLMCIEVEIVLKYNAAQ